MHAVDARQSLLALSYEDMERFYEEVGERIGPLRNAVRSMRAYASEDDDDGE